MVKVLVIGATGYLGLPITQALRRSSNTVYGLARSQPKANLLSSNEIIPIIGSVEDPASYVSTIESANIDVVVDASATYEGAHQVLQSLITVAKARIQRNGGGRIPKIGYVYISGLWVHGDSTKPVNDLSLVGLPHSNAEPSKIVGFRPALEREILVASDILSVAVVRPALMFGKNQSAWGVLFGPIFHAAKEGVAKLSVPAKKDAMLSLVHVDDCAEGVSAVVDNLALISNAENYPVFDLTGTYESMQIIVEHAAKALGYKGELVFAGGGDNLLTDAMSATIRGDSHRAKVLLGWAPKRRGFTEEMEIHVGGFLASQA